MPDTAPAVPAPQTAGPEALSTQQPPRPKALSLRKNFGWTFAGNVVNAGSQWALVAIMAKLGSAEMVGLYSWALAVVLPITTLAMLQLRALLITDRADEHAFRDYLGLRLLGMVLATVGIVGYALMSGLNFNVMLILILVTVSRAIDGTSDLFRGLFQKHERMNLSASNMMLRGVVSLVTVGTVLLLWRDLTLALAAMCIGWLAITIFYDLPRARQFTHGLSDLLPRLHWDAVRRILPPALPMGLVMALIAFQTAIPRLFLEAWHGTEAVGYFSAVLYPLSTGTIIVGALGQSALPRLSQYFRDNRPAFLRLLGKLAGIGLLLGLAAVGVSWLLGEPLLALAYTRAFAVYQPELVIMAVGTIFLFVSSFFGYALTAARQFYIQPVMTIISCGAALGASAWLIPTMGVTGGAWAYTVMAIVSCVASGVCFAWTLNRGPGANGGAEAYVCGR